MQEYIQLHMLRIDACPSVIISTGEALVMQFGLEEREFAFDGWFKGGTNGEQDGIHG